MAHVGGNGPTPFTTPPSMKVAAGLSNDNEYACIWTGQSQSRPWGQAEEAYDFAEFLRLEETGIDIAAMGGITIPNDPDREVGMVEVLSVDNTVVSYNGQWNSGSVYLRFGTKTDPLKGYALVIDSSDTNNTITVEWIVLPANGPATPAAYLVRETSALTAGFNFYAYERVRPLTAYLPTKDIVPAYQNAASSAWVVPKQCPYPAPNAALGAALEGRSLVLPLPYSVPAAVTDFSDLGLFLPLTRREGADGFGMSEIADSQFTGAAGTEPVGHPITDITGNVFTFANAMDDAAGLNITDPTDILKQAFLLIDWEQGGQSKRSWGIVDTNDATTFTVTGAWLGDGAPDDPDDSAVTFSTGTHRVTWTGHTLVEGDRVAFHGGTMPTGVVEGRVYRVRNPITNEFQISESMDHPTVQFGTTGSGVTGVQAWVYTVWIQSWRDNPYTWLPGPEFAYPNEDAMPAAPFVHFRARGVPWWGHEEILGKGPYSLTPHDNEAEGRFGAVLPFGMRMALALGKRINMVILGVSGAPLTGFPRLSRAGTHNGQLGWWNHKQFGFGVALEDSSSFLAARLKRLIETISVQALLAESAGKTIKYLSSCHVQSQTDSVANTSRKSYVAAIADFKRWQRDMVTAMGASAYADPAEMPFAQPLQSHYPWETDGVSAQGTFQAFGIDSAGQMNNTLREENTQDEFGDYVLVEDLPKLPTDWAHWSGQGMAELGARLATAILFIVEHALSYTSNSLLATNPRLLEVANIALERIGQGARPIASLQENTIEARKINRFMPQAIQQVLSMRNWSWATRHEPATQVKHERTDWEFAYVIPGRAVRVIKILPFSDHQNVSGAGTAGVVQVPTTPGVGTTPWTEEARPPYREPEPFEIGRSPSGHRLLFCNVAEKSGDVSVEFVIDGELHPERLPVRPQLVYVDRAMDPSRFSESFMTALTWYLAAELATSLIRGDEGAAVRAQCLQQMHAFLDEEAVSEANQQQLPNTHLPDFLKAR